MSWKHFSHSTVIIFSAFLLGPADIFIRNEHAYQIQIQKDEHERQVQMFEQQIELLESDGYSLRFFWIACNERNNFTSASSRNRFELEMQKANELSRALVELQVFEFIPFVFVLTEFS